MRHLAAKFGSNQMQTIKLYKKAKSWQTDIYIQFYIYILVNNNRDGDGDGWGLRGDGWGLRGEGWET